jgi:hypothetical protein
MGKVIRRKKKINWVALSKSKKYKIVIFSAIAVGLICVAIGLYLFGQVSKTTLPLSLRLETMANAIPIPGLDKEYTVKLTQAETIVVLTGTKAVALGTPITFTRVGGCVDLIEAISPMYYEGYTTIRPKPDAPNHASGDLIISCGSQKAIILHIETYFD